MTAFVIFVRDCKSSIDINSPSTRESTIHCAAAPPSPPNEQNGNGSQSVVFGTEASASSGKLPETGHSRPKSETGGGAWGLAVCFKKASRGF